MFSDSTSRATEHGPWNTGHRIRNKEHGTRNTEHGQNIVIVQIAQKTQRSEALIIPFFTEVTREPEKQCCQKVNLFYQKFDLVSKRGHPPLAERSLRHGRCLSL